MLVVFGISLTILFVILWRSGLLDDLMARGRSEKHEPWQQDRKRIKDSPMDPEMEKRLEVFEEFMDELSDQEDD